jgi:nitroreductase
MQLTSELLFQYHKLEKGLVMPGPKRFFGEEPAKAVLDLLAIWHAKNMSQVDPIYLGALETLHAYQNRLISASLDQDDKIVSTLHSFLHNYPIRTENLTTPQPLMNAGEQEDINLQFFTQLANARRSVRSFSSQAVPPEKIEKAVKLAQLSPSACNRQPCRVYLIKDETRKKALLALQNGNRGFGHLIPTLAVITSDSGAFLNASERHEPYLDGGLFSMSFMYALTSQDLATCCLNWCASPSQDKHLRELLPLTDSEQVLMLMAIGYSEPDTLVPRSPRKSTESVMIEMD